MNYYSQKGLWADYTPAERNRFMLHTMIAVACLPLYVMFPFKFGLLTAPYLFFLAVRPRNEYLLPIIIHMIYGTQQRLLFLFGCFLYVLIHCSELRKHGLSWAYAFYMVCFPYFLWYFWQKLHMPRFETGIGQYFGGLMSHFVFSAAFWGALVVKKTGRPFFRGIVFVLFGLILSLAVVGGGATLDRGMGEGESHTVFSHMIFYAAPVMAASFVFLCLSRRQGFEVEKIVSGIGCLIILTGVVGLHKLNVTFTVLGLSLFAALTVFLAQKSRGRFLKFVHPLPLFIISAFVVLSSQKYVDKYGGMFRGEGTYNEMKIDSVGAFFKKMQRKAIDDRASVWGLTLQYINREILPNPIWVKPAPYMEVDMQTESGKTYVSYVAMASHNMMLNQIRCYGFYGGLGLYLLYIYFACRKVDGLILKDVGGYSPVIMAVSLAEFVIGGHTGHYPVIPSVGSVIFMCIGACWGEYYANRRRVIWRNQECAFFQPPTPQYARM